MKNKEKALIILIAFVILILLFIVSFNYLSSQYEETIPPKVKASNLQSLVALLIKNQEVFTGSVNVKYIDSTSGNLNKAEITIQNTTIYDDSIGAREDNMIAEKKGKIWAITDDKIRWKCARDYFFSYWTIKSCP